MIGRRVSKSVQTRMRCTDRELGVRLPALQTQILKMENINYSYVIMVNLRLKILVFLEVHVREKINGLSVASGLPFQEILDPPLK